MMPSYNVKFIENLFYLVFPLIRMPRNLPAEIIMLQWFGGKLVPEQKRERENVCVRGQDSFCKVQSCFSAC